MRLVILTSEFPPGPGGIGTHAFNIASELHRLGWQVTVIGRQDYVSRKEREYFNAALPFEMVSLRQWASTSIDGLYRWSTALDHLVRRRPDIVMVTGAVSAWVGAALPRPVPLVTIGHGTELGLTGWRGSLTRWAFQRADHVVCVSEFTRDYMLRKGVKPKNISVITNGADESSFFQLPQKQVAEFKQRKGFSGCHLILTVGHVSERKGQDIVIRALPKILRHVPGTHYVIVGLPTRQEAYQQLARELGVEDHVHFLGRVSPDELVHLYNACDIFVLTSRHTDDGDFEGYGIVVVEAALCGTPAVVAGGSGLSEAVRHGITGLVVPPESPDETAQAILQLLENESLRQRLASQAETLARTEQTWARRAEEYDALFRKLARL